MAEAMILNAQAREDIGKGASRRLRRADKVPGIIYGGDVEPVRITLEGKQIRRALENDSFYSQIITVDVDGKTQQAILKDIQRHPAKEFAMHMDFLRVKATEAISTRVPLHFLNEELCKGVKEQGGAITHLRVEVGVTCLPANLPEFIDVDMTDVELGSTLRLSDLNVPADVVLTSLTLPEPKDNDVASVQATRATVEDEEESAEGEEAGSEE
ncbi:50S ribosomal protein L25 [invertebrate metagenome]|uniref:50S ribosomal protein L25 n=1 Tax=invertebrate metagenome TaxID=1711999 RepID=A0A2H9TCM1_9ZZZZ